MEMLCRGKGQNIWSFTSVLLIKYVEARVMSLLLSFWGYYFLVLGGGVDIHLFLLGHV